MKPAVARVFASYPPPMRRKLLRLRRLVLATAAKNGVGKVEETLKWGEPAYLPATPGIGTAVRIGWKKSKPSQYSMFFHCQTTLVDTFRTLFPTDFKYEGNRAIVFAADDKVPARELSFCVAAALSYHRDKRD